MGNITQKNNSKNKASTSNVGCNNLMRTPSIPIYERATTSGNSFTVTLNHETISPILPKRFVIPIPFMLTINFILIETDIYLLLERNVGYFSPNAVYSVKLTSQNRLLNCTLDLKIEELTFFISKIPLKQYEQADGSLVILFERKLAQNSTAASLQQTLSRTLSTLPQQSILTRPSSVSAQQRSALQTLISPQPSSSQLSSTLPQRTIARQSSVSSQQRSAQPFSVSSQQNLKGKLKCEQIQRSSDNSFANGKFRLTVSELKNLIQARAPLFSFDNMQIGFTVSKNKRNNANESLRVILYHKDLKGGSLQMESKLISFISRNPIVRKVNRSNIQNKNTCSDIMNWNQLFISPNVFVQNDSCVIEVEIKIEKNRTPTAQASEQRSKNTARMECPICMDEMANKSKSSTQCGHIFCSPCISRSVSIKPTCPLCNKPVSAGSLRPIFIS